MGNLKLTNVEPPTRYTINLRRSGQRRRLRRGAADVALTASTAIDHPPTRRARPSAARWRRSARARSTRPRPRSPDDFFRAFEAGKRACRALPA
jgi:hypothetical protein